MKTKFLLILSTIILTLQSCVAPAYASDIATKSQLVDYTQGLYISDKTTYIPDGYSDFIAFKNYVGGHTIAYFNKKFKVRYNGNYNEIIGDFGFLTFDTIEKLVEYCEKGGDIKLEKSNRLLINKTEDGIYTMSCNIVLEKEAWLKHPYNSSAYTLAGLNKNQIFGKLMEDIIGCLPIIMLTIIWLISIRKAIKWIYNTMRGA